MLLTVTHSYGPPDGEVIGNGQTTISLSRVASRIGFSKPQVHVEKWTAGAKRTLGTLGVQS